MRFSKHLNYPKAQVMFVLLAMLLFGSSAFAHTFNSPASKKLTLANLVEEVTEASHLAFKPYTPFQNQNAETPGETELRAEEEDTTEKDDADNTSGLSYEVNGIWVKLSACTGRALSRIAGSNHLYILFHSWKLFFH